MRLAPSASNQIDRGIETRSGTFTTNYRWMAMVACSLIVLGMVTSPAIGVDVSGDAGMYDSGWAVSGPVVEGDRSLLESRRVPVEQLLPRQEIDRITVPKRKQAATAPKAESAAPLRSRTRGQTGKAPSQPRTPIAGTPSAKKPKLQQSKPRQPGDISNAFALPGKPIATAPPEDAAGLPKAKSARPQATEEKSASPKIAEVKPTPQPTADKNLAPREPAPFPGIGPEIGPVIGDTDATAKATPLPGADAPAPVVEGPETPQPVERAPRIAKRPTPPKKAPAKIPTKQEPPTKPAAPKAEAEPKSKPKESKAEEAKPAPAESKEAPAEEVAAEPEASTDDTPEYGPQLPRPTIGISAALKPALDTPLKPLSRSQQYLRRRLRSVLSYYYRRPLNSRDHDPWEVMHGMLAYGLHSRILDSTARSKPVTAIGYLCFNKPCKRKRLLHLTPDGQIDADVAYGLQGHRGQFLAMLAQCNVSPDYPIRVADKEFTIADLIAYEMKTCYTDTELTFKLISLAHYLDFNETWVSDDGETWSIPRLINEERHQKIRGAACGGTHRLSGIALAARLRVARGEPLDGEYLEAQRFTEQQQNYAFRLQNRDGSLSTEWFRGPGAEEDINRRVRTTGHILEWLLYSLPEERMTDSRTVRAVNYLTSLLSSNTDNAWEVGPLSHALHALMLYDERVFQPHDKAPQMASNGQDQGGQNRNGQNSASRSPSPRALSYQTIGSRVYGSYPSAEEAEKAREEAQSPGGLRGLFGIGQSRNRRSR